MKCFNHSEVDAVGLCKNCCKAICKECITDLKNGIACKDACEEQVKTVIKIIERNHNAVKKESDTYKTLSESYKVNSFLYISLGSLFLIASLIWHIWFISILGIIFIIGGIYTFKHGKVYKQRSEESKFQEN